MLSVIALILLQIGGCRDTRELNEKRKPSGAVSTAKIERSDVETRYLSQEFEEVRLDFHPLPEATRNGELPRTHAGYTLLDPDFPGGKEYTKGEVLHLEDKINGLRLRLFFQDGVIIRIITFWPLVSKERRLIDDLFDEIETAFGNPNRELPGEWIYASPHTVLLFSIGGGYLITDLADAARVEFPPHVAELIQDEIQ